MKKIFTACAILLFALELCAAQAYKITLDVQKDKKSYGNKITVSPMDKSVSISKGKVVISAKKEGAEYTISGYFNGQVISKTKNTIIKLDNAYLENTGGEAALYGEAKTEISAAKNSVNYIVSYGTYRTGQVKSGALQCKKDLVIGGSGTLYVQGNVYHGAKADDVKMKGTGTFYMQGTQKGSALNCQTFTVENEKTFKAYFINSKNGIKADGSISIASGNFYLYDNETALKTDLNDGSAAGSEPHGINLMGGAFYTYQNSKFYVTENDGFKKSKNVKIIEE